MSIFDYLSEEKHYGGNNPDKDQSIEQKTFKDATSEALKQQRGGVGCVHNANEIGQESAERGESRTYAKYHCLNGNNDKLNNVILNDDMSKN